MKKWEIPKNDDEPGWHDTATPWGFGSIAQLTTDPETPKEKKERLATKMRFIGFYPND